MILNKKNTIFIFLKTSMYISASAELVEYSFEEARIGLILPITG